MLLAMSTYYLLIIYRRILDSEEELDLDEEESRAEYICNGCLEEEAKLGQLLHGCN